MKQSSLALACTMKEPAARTYMAYQTTVWVNRGGRWVAMFNQETPPR